MMHVYVFLYREGCAIPFYERTFPHVGYAMRWLRGKNGFACVNCLPERYFY